jgi:PhnB protein
MEVNPYLFYNGNCEEAFRFYARVLGGQTVAMVRYEEMPAAEQMAEHLRSKIAHVRMVVGSTVLMGGDAPPDRYDVMKGFAVTLNTPEAAVAERVFNALAEGGTITMPIGETFWAVRFGMLVDRFGTPWMINCEKPR